MSLGPFGLHGRLSFVALAMGLEKSATHYGIASVTGPQSIHCLIQLAAPFLIAVRLRLWHEGKLGWPALFKSRHPYTNEPHPVGQLHPFKDMPRRIVNGLGTNHAMRKRDLQLYLPEIRVLDFQRHGTPGQPMPPQRGSHTLGMA